MGYEYSSCSEDEISEHIGKDCYYNTFSETEIAND